MRWRILALASLGWGLSSLSLVACAGDDTNPPLPDGGSPDATTNDGSLGDATGTSDADAGATVNDDGSVCVPFDGAVYSADEVEAGLGIVIFRKCEQCHGEQLQGNQNGLPSTNAEGGTAYPPDLTPDPTYGLGCWTNARIERAFLYGIDKEGQPLCNPMPHFGEQGDAGIDEAGAAAVVAYLRNLPSVATHVPATPACYPPPPVDAGEEDSGIDAAVDAGPDASADAGDAGDATVADSGSDATVADGASDASDAEVEDAASDAEDAASDAGLDAD